MDGWMDGANTHCVRMKQRHQGVVIGWGFCKYDITTAETERLKNRKNYNVSGIK